VRSVLVPDSVNPAKTGGTARVTEAQLMAMAQDRKTVDLVKISRQMRNVWDERPESTAGGSFRYWTNPQMLPVHGINLVVYGINVSGEIANPPSGELDIWVRVEGLAKVSGVYLLFDFKFDTGNRMPIPKPILIATLPKNSFWLRLRDFKPKPPANRTPRASVIRRLGERGAVIESAAWPVSRDERKSKARI
jgi:hypothetical protein